MKKDKAITKYIEETIYDLPRQKGKAWKRKSDSIIFESIEKLGMLFFLNGKKLKKPIQEKPEDFELIDLNKEGNE